MQFKKEYCTFKIPDISGDYGVLVQLVQFFESIYGFYQFACEHRSWGSYLTMNFHVFYLVNVLYSIENEKSPVQTALIVRTVCTGHQLLKF